MSAEKLKIPNKVVNADWKDDVYGIDFDEGWTDKEAMEYISPDTISGESIEKIKSINLRQQFRQRGQKIGKLFSLENL